MLDEDGEVQLAPVDNIVSDRPGNPLDDPGVLAGPMTFHFMLASLTESLRCVLALRAVARLRVLALPMPA
jgi:hypothetical protein